MRFCHKNRLLLSQLLLLAACAAPQPQPELPVPGVSTEAECREAFGRRTDYVRATTADGYALTAFIQVGSDLTTVTMHFNSEGILTGYGPVTSSR